MKGFCFILTFFILPIFFQMYSKEIRFGRTPFKTVLNTDLNSCEKKRICKDTICSTEAFYNRDTAVTFFGDSRIDLVSNLFYGAGSLDAYIGASEGSWNVQNFGVSAMTSEGLRNLIQFCFSRDDSNPTLPKYPAFKITYNVAFEIGGNDFLTRFPLFILFPTLYITEAPQARDNITSIIYTLQRRERNVLLIGNYPAVAHSLSLGRAESYAWRDVNPKVASAVLQSEQNQETKQLITEISKKLLVGSIFLPGTWNLLLSIGSSFPGQLDSDINFAYQSALRQLRLDEGRFDDAQIARMPIGSYTWWKKIASTSIATVPSLGIVFLENELRNLNANPGAFELRPFHYVSTLEFFLHPKARSEPWVVNPDLMGDLVHKNHLGYLVWGRLVGDKIRALEWDKVKGVDDSLGSNKINFQLARTLQALRRRYEA